MNTNCIACGQVNLYKNTIGLNKKMLGRGVENFFCINCLADYLGTTKDDLLDKIEEFKNEGCDLFR